MPIDYSHWKKIEVSDDEDDVHPNIDTPSLFRWRHQARLEKMAQKKEQELKLKKEKEEVEKQKQELEQKFKNVDIENNDEYAKISEEIKKQEEEYKKKEEELIKNNLNEAWNIDTIGKVTTNASRINKASNKRIDVSKKNQTGEEMVEYFEKYSLDLKKLEAVVGDYPLQKFLLDNPNLVDEDATSWLTLEALNYARVEEFDKMKNCIEKCVIIQYILEGGQYLNEKPSDPRVINEIFAKKRRNVPEVQQVYTSNIQDMEDRIKKRAIEKNMEADKEAREKRISESPGGMDPVEVINSMPQELADCFVNRDKEQLIKVASTMPQDVFAYHLDRCIKAGLWNTQE
ncbi:Hsp90 co-chaperone Cdc37 [Strongyloides ratti]|uniref:Hsp90 chaperone protein kinase-targeting subunit n=1 Tax=Strongyloides ratti TaxID=34506 RepID=A0A090LAF3_STRRB|nr:Hsp90 co-chaperone Cdc37 [Strongyloides ratti]CEF64520.1 Hsp90 co-chaperone Cdc37 [Strongyloides ratti]